MQEDKCMPEPASGRVRLGVSACLLGARVRFDGGHKRNRFVVDELGACFDLVPYCPEVAIGMEVPRAPVRLAGRAGAPRVVGSRDNNLDVTEALRDYSSQAARRLDHLSGFVFKKGSPSCGMERVKVYGDKGMPHRDGVGLFAREVQTVNPLLPVEEEGRLNDPRLRENFVTRVGVYARWQALRRAGISKRGLTGFHARHKLLLMAHSPAACSRLGRMLACLDGAQLEQVAADYIARVMQTLKIPVGRGRHVNVLQHLLGYLRRHLDGVSRIDLVEVIDAYRLGRVPLVVPLALLRHHFRRSPHPYVDLQVYMDPHPPELMLRNLL